MIPEDLYNVQHFRIKQNLSIQKCSLSCVKDVRDALLDKETNVPFLLTTNTRVS